MVKVDLQSMDRLAKKISTISSNSGDAFGRLLQINNEISYDTELLLYSQSQTLLGNLSDAVESFRTVDNMLQSLDSILTRLPDEYDQIEEYSRKANTRMAIMMEELSSAFNVNVLSLSKRPSV